MTQPKAPWTRMPKYARAAKKKPKRGIKPRSKRMDLIMRKLYLPMRKKWLNGKMCCLYVGEKADEVHHGRGRNETLLIDQRWWFPVSRCAHQFFHENPDAARRYGVMCEKGLWNVAPKDAETERLRGLIAEVTRGK